MALTSATVDTLPLRGRVGAKLRGGVMCRTSAFINKVELVARITPTRRFAATSPLKGEVGDHFFSASPTPLQTNWVVKAFL